MKNLNWKVDYLLLPIFFISTNKFIFVSFLSLIQCEISFLDFTIACRKYSISVPGFWPHVSSLVSKPPTAKCASIGAKNSTRATTVESSSRYSRKRIQDAGEVGNTCNDNRFRRPSRSKIAYAYVFDPSSKRPLCYRVTFFGSSNFVRMDLFRWILGLQFCRVQSSCATHVHLTCKLPIYYVFMRELNQLLR